MADPSSLPSVDRILNLPDVRVLVHRHGRTRVTATVRTQIAALRAGIRTDERAPVPDEATIARAVGEALSAMTRRSLRKVANLTGTVLHTNLGRAVLPDAAIEALAEAAAHACNVEFDLDTGERGERDAHVEATLRELTGAEAVLVVNNNAAAVFLVLNTLALRREAIVSRGELVEIGGQFRIPDVMVRAGARLREVGATNRTHLRDYAEAIGAKTALLLKVHTSNYEVRGFTSSVDVDVLAPLAREHGLPLVADLGSGTLLDLRLWGLPYEPTVRTMIEAGADLVTFSGDKLLGGPQCGIVAGRKSLVDRLRRNPLKRALRVDKLVLAALSEVLLLYLHAERLPETLPTLRFLVRTAADIRPVAAELAAAFSRSLPAQFAIEVVECTSQIGSGALPVDVLPSAGVRLSSTAPRRDRDRAIQQLARALRALPTPIVARTEDHALLLDCRCLDDASELAAMLAEHREAFGPNEA